MPCGSIAEETDGHIRLTSKKMAQAGGSGEQNNELGRGIMSPLPRPEQINPTVVSLIQ